VLVHFWATWCQSAAEQGRPRLARDPGHHGHNSGSAMTRTLRKEAGVYLDQTGIAAQWGVRAAPSFIADGAGRSLESTPGVGCARVCGWRLVAAADRAITMQIWVDADACPKVINDILFRAAERLAVR
jgi:hypothetical protein